LFEERCTSQYERDVVALNIVAKQLRKLIRYERKAANARDKALRELEKAKAHFLSEKASTE